MKLTLNILSITCPLALALGLSVARFQNLSEPIEKFAARAAPVGLAGVVICGAVCYAAERGNRGKGGAA